MLGLYTDLGGDHKQFGLLTNDRDHLDEDVGVEADPDDGEDEGEKEVAAVLLRPAVRDGGDSESLGVEWRTEGVGESHKDTVIRGAGSERIY